MKINATAVIDNLIHEFNDIEKFHHVRNGKYLYLDSLEEKDPRKIAYEKSDAAQKRLNLTSDVLDMTTSALYGAVLAARRWYKRTDWQKCLSEDDAERLLSCMMIQYPKYKR